MNNPDSSFYRLTFRTPIKAIAMNQEYTKETDTAKDIKHASNNCIMQYYFYG